MNPLENIVLNLKSFLTASPIRVPLDSSALKAISYERGRKSLVVEFTNGGIYEYGSVEPAQFKALLNADSAGRFFIKEIRNSYPYRKVN